MTWRLICTSVMMSRLAMPRAAGVGPSRRRHCRPPAPGRSSLPREQSFGGRFMTAKTWAVGGAAVHDLGAQCGRRRDAPGRDAAPSLTDAGGSRRPDGRRRRPVQSSRRAPRSVVERGVEDRHGLLQGVRSPPGEGRYRAGTGAADVRRAKTSRRRRVLQRVEARLDRRRDARLAEAARRSAPRSGPAWGKRSCQQR